MSIVVEMLVAAGGTNLINDILSDRPDIVDNTAFPQCHVLVLDENMGS